MAGAGDPGTTCVYRAAGWVGGGAHANRRCRDARMLMARAAGERWLRDTTAEKGKEDNEGDTRHGLSTGGCRKVLRPELF